MHTLGHDFRRAIRLLLKDRRFSIAAIAALALGIGATNTVFTIVYAALIRPLPFAEPERLVAIQSATVHPLGGVGVSLADLSDLRRASTTLESIGAVWIRRVTLGDANGTDRIAGAFVSADTFRMLGVRPSAGRDFTAADDERGAERVALISSTIWRTRFDSDPNVIGRSVRVDSMPATVVGVMPDGFGFPANSEIWVPLGQMYPRGIPARDQRNLQAHSRLKAGITLEQANQELRALSTSLTRQYPATNRNSLVVARPFRERAAPTEMRTVVLALFGAVAFVLLIACVNVTNLLMARAAHRGREIATRLSLGASRWRIVRQLLIESLVLASASGMLALWISVAAVRAFTLAIAESGAPYWLMFSFEPQVFVFLAATCLLTAVLFGLTPALYATRADLAGMINESSKGTSVPQKHHVTTLLVGSQFALAVTLLAGSGLMIRTVLILTSLPTGVDTSNLVEMSVAPAGQRYPDTAARTAFYRQLEERLAAAPGLGPIAVASDAPRSGGSPRRSVRADAAAAPSGSDEVTSLQVTVGDSYLHAVGARLLSGRWFNAGDRMRADQVAVINERFAIRQFGERSAVGRLLRFEQRFGERNYSEPVEVIGVISNIRQLRGTDSEFFDDGFEFVPVVYTPLESGPPAEATIVARAAALEPLVTYVREQLRAIDPDVALYDIRTVDDGMATNSYVDRVLVTIFTVFAALAVALAGIGLYGVSAYAVTQRAREIAVRVALGATGREVIWLMGRQTALQLAIGTLVGMAGAALLARALQGFLIQVEFTDMVTLGSVMTLLLMIAATASWAPTRRALALDPAAILRSE